MTSNTCRGALASLHFKPARLAATLLFGVAVFLFYFIWYRGHMHYQEQMQLFLFTSAYAGDVICTPGGLADYIGRFLTQFAYHSWLGALVYALLLMALQRGCLLVCRNRGPLAFALSFLPPVLMWMALCDADVLLTAAVSVILSVWAAWVVCLVDRLVARLVVAAVAVPLVYLACGPLGLLFPALISVSVFGRSVNRGLLLLFPVVMAVAAVLCVVLVSLPPVRGISDFWSGTHYHRFAGESVSLAWWAAAAVVAVAALGVLPAATPSGKSTSGSRRVSWSAVAAALAVAAFALWGVALGRADYRSEAVFEYDRLASQGRWQEIIDLADTEPVVDLIQANYLNLALAMQGRLEHDLFRYSQHGAVGLVAPFGDNFFSPVATAEAYYRMGAHKCARQFVFDMQQSVPDRQLSQRFTRRLAELYLIDGEYALARKYLKTLEHSLFYDDWARERLAMCDARSVDSDPEYAAMRSARITEDGYFDDSDPARTISSLLEADPSNKTAASYYVACCLLNKDIPALKALYADARPGTLPVPVQEALVYDWALENQTLDGMPWPVSPDVNARFRQALRGMRPNMSPEQVEALCPATYWGYMMLN